MVGSSKCQSVSPLEGLRRRYFVHRLCFQTYKSQVVGFYLTALISGATEKKSSVNHSVNVEETNVQYNGVVDIYI